MSEALTNNELSEMEMKVLPGGTTELNIRRGDLPKLPPIPAPEQRTFKGDIGSIMKFISHQAPDNKKAHVVLDRTELSATLYVDATNPLSEVIEGVLEVNDEFEVFDINGKMTRNRDQMISFLRDNRYLFVDKEEHARLVEQIKSFVAKVQTELQQSNDNQGNRIDNFVKTLKAEVMTFIDVKVSIFKGQPRVPIKLEICFDVLEKLSRFWFQSDSLSETIETEIKTQFDEMEGGLSSGGYLALKK